MTLHSEMDMAWELGAAIELDVQPERLGDRNSERSARLHMQFKPPLSLIQGFVLCLIAVLLVSRVGRRSSRCLGCNGCKKA